jgi:hypothetical protein
MSYPHHGSRMLAFAGDLILNSAPLGKWCRWTDLYVLWLSGCISVKLRSSVGEPAFPKVTGRTQQSTEVNPQPTAFSSHPRQDRKKVLQTSSGLQQLQCALSFTPFNLAACCLLGRAIIFHLAHVSTSHVWHDLKRPEAE